METIQLTTVKEMNSFIDTLVLRDLREENEEEDTRVQDRSPTGVVGAERTTSFATPEKMLSSSRHRVSMITLSDGKSRARIVKGMFNTEKSPPMEGECQSKLHRLIVEHTQALPLEEWEDLETEDDDEEEFYEETTEVEENKHGEIECYCSSIVTPSQTEQSDAVNSTYAAMAREEWGEEESSSEELDLYLGAPSPVNSNLTEPGTTPMSTGEFTFETIEDDDEEEELEEETIYDEDYGTGVNAVTGASTSTGISQKGASEARPRQQQPEMKPPPARQHPRFEWEHLMENNVEDCSPRITVHPDPHSTNRLNKNNHQPPLAEVSTNPLSKRLMKEHDPVLKCHRMIHSSATEQLQ
jgi:hypothetical protein